MSGSGSILAASFSDGETVERAMTGIHDTESHLEMEESRCSKEGDIEIMSELSFIHTNDSQYSDHQALG